jgi:hypothetical protein
MYHDRGTEDSSSLTGGDHPVVVGQGIVVGGKTFAGSRALKIEDHSEGWSGLPRFLGFFRRRGSVDKKTLED